MKKPLTFSMLATTALLALVGFDRASWLRLTDTPYGLVQSTLAGFAAVILAMHLYQRFSRKALSPAPLLFAIVAGTLAGVLAIKGPACTTFMSSMGNTFAHASVAMLVINVLLCMATYGATPDEADSGFGAAPIPS